MKRSILFFTVLLFVFSSGTVISYAYDATGLWNYSEHSPWTNCQEEYVPVSGQVGILQTGSTFLIVGDHFSTYGTVSGDTYSYSDNFCEEGGTTSADITITMTSGTTATGNVSWTWSDPGGSCSGGHQITLNKQPQAPPVYDASGRWTFDESGFTHNCDSATPASSAYLDLTQTGNKITAVDDEGKQHSGFVDGSQYAVVRSYLDQGGRTTEWITVTLNSATQGSGTAKFVWDDDCDDCAGNWDLSVAKQAPVKPTGVTIPWLPLLLSDDAPTP